MTLKWFRWQTLGGCLLLAILLSFMLPTVQAQDTNLCRDGGATTIEYDETLTGTLTVDFPVQFYCFDGERGDEVTVGVVATSGNIVPAVVVATPFLSAEGLLVDAPLAEGQPTGNVAAIEVTADIDSDGQYLIVVQTLVQAEGTFDITVEASGGTSLLGSGDETEDTSESPEAVPLSEIIPGQTNLCDLEESIDIVMGESVESTFAEPGAATFACFEASAGDVVTIEIETIAGDGIAGFVVTTPFYDFAETTPYFGQGFATTVDEVATLELLIEQTGSYNLLILSVNGQMGSFSLTVNSELGTLYSCENAPLDLLTSASWGVVQSSDESPLLQINIGCSDLLAITTLGISEISAYRIQQDDTFQFGLQNMTFTTISLSEDEWIVEDLLGTQYTLAPITEADQCTDDLSLALFRASWQWITETGQTLILDFTCNGIVIVDNLSSEERFTVPYSI
ncbi:MAG: hypothetical protein AAFN11_17880, partial [Chloroflexota bacterium]